MEWPFQLDVALAEGQLLARGDLDLPFDQVQPVTISVMGCSIWRRVFISMK